MPAKKQPTEKNHFSGATKMEIEYGFKTPLQFVITVDISDPFPDGMAPEAVESLMLVTLSHHLERLAQEMTKEKPWSVQILDASDTETPDDSGSPESSIH